MGKVHICIQSIGFTTIFMLLATLYNGYDDCNGVDRKVNFVAW